MDADTFIIDDSKDISRFIPRKSEIGWTYHTYSGQSHPNTGVMFLRKSRNLLEILKSAYEQVDLLDHPWWDQAALMRVLGIESTLHPVGAFGAKNKLSLKETKLANDWNSIYLDSSVRPRIRHFAGEDHLLRKLALAEYAGNSLPAEKIRKDAVHKIYSFETILNQRDHYYQKYIEMQGLNKAGESIQEFEGKD